MITKWWRVGDGYVNMRWLHYSTLVLSFGGGLFKRKEGTGFMTNTVIDGEKLPGP